MEAAGVLMLMSGDPRIAGASSAATAAWDKLAGRTTAHGQLDLGQALVASGQAVQAASCLTRPAALERLAES